MKAPSHTVQGLASAGGNTDVVYSALRSEILSGELPPGAVISQVQLAARYGVSRAPLREALRLLQNEGLVNGVHNRRMRIAPLDRDDLEELYALRILTEPLAVALSVPLLTDDDVFALRAANDRLRAATQQGDVPGAFEPHRRFHFGLACRAQERMRQQVESLWDYAERYRRCLPGRRDAAAHFELTAHEHDAMLTAAEARDGEVCGAYVAHQLSRVGLGVMAMIDPAHDPRVLRLAIQQTPRMNPPETEF